MIAITLPTCASFALGLPLLLATPSVTGVPILETSDGSLTSYLADATSVQGVSPRVEQRGAFLDGSLRARPSFPMHLAGNPLDSPWSSNQQIDGIHLATGAFTQAEVDLVLPSDGPRWVVGRTYNARQDDGAHLDSNGYQGKNWFQSSQPEIVLYEHSSDDAEDMVYLVYGADRFVAFKRKNAASDEFKGVNGAAGAIQFAEDGSGADTYTYTDQWGFQYVFFGFDNDADPAKGQFWKVSDPDGNVAFVGHETDKSIAINGQVSPAINAGYDSGGRVRYAYDATDRRYTYTYTALNSVERLTEVKAETKTGGTWNGTPTGVTEVGKVQYEYYGTSESYGGVGNLKLVEITVPLSESTVSQTKKKYYRYWTGAYNATTNPGHENALKLVLDFEGTRRFDYTDSTFDEDFLAASQSSLESYAGAYVEYDSSHRVNEAWFNGECGCSGGTTGTHELEYETNGLYSDGHGYDTTWATRTVVKRPDDSYLTQVFDEVGQSLHQIITDADPDNTSPSPSRWVTKVTRNSDGVVTELSTPANITGYTHSSGAITTSTSAGLVRTFTLETTGETTGFVLDRKYKEGSSGSAYLDGSRTYTTASVTVGDVTVVRPFVASEREYTQAITSGTTGSNLTSYSYTMYSGLLMPEEIETTNPAVSTANNGSGSATTRTVHFTKEGRKNWEEDELGILSHTKFTDGLATERVRDANEVHAAVPTGWGSSSDAHHRVETTSFDAQGRRDSTTEAGGRVRKRYLSKLADERLVELNYADYETGPTKYFGPVRYTVRNQAGKVEFQGVVGLTNDESTTALASHVDETDDDPITAMDLASVLEMRTSLYDSTGERLEEQRVYFSIPSSGEGTDGTHYDATLFGYDDAGNKTRTKEASGTIRRTVYDLHRRATERWIGTNDSTFDGGEASGTDNMVKTEEREYDGGADDGDGHLTEHTLFVEDSTTDERVTSYEHDVRGHLLLQTNPTSPHFFHKVDNLGRTVAAGSFSATTNIVVGTDDPTTETSNRLALSQSFYDERGRMWKRQRHEIDAADGSDDDNLVTEYWFDAVGRRIQVDGSELAKTAYDRLGRQTHRYVLAKNNDTTYADADDVTGDIVLVEDQVVYESADEDEVLMQARISRFHDDHGAGQTTGALDTNADSDSLKYTAANIEGRIQIRAFWYDRFGRMTDEVNYGTGAATGSAGTLDRDGLAVPARSDTALRTTYDYNGAGRVEDTTDPRGLVARQEFDAAGRVTKRIRNYVDGTPGPGDDDQTVSYGFVDGLRTTITADLPSGETDQVTTYSYGTTKGASAGDSKIETGHLLQEVEYPDSTGASDVVTYAYNAQGQEIYRKDQAGNVFETEYDDSGRQEHRRVTTLASGFDGAVRRISMGYDDLGRSETTTQYDNAAVGSGSVTDEVKTTYDGWGNVEKIEQDNNSAVGASGSVDDYEITYAYDTYTSPGRNAIRRNSLTMPSGNVISYTYRTVAGGHDQRASRVTSVEEGANVLAVYEYNGFDQVVGTDYSTIDVKQERFGSTSGDYTALDRFDRVVTDQWSSYKSTSTEFYDVDLTYDRNSSVTSLDDHVHAGFDVDYTMDDLDRLTEAEEGTLSGGSITSKTRSQEWTLTQTGNWDVAKLDLNGDSDFIDTDEYNDDRTHNDVNELTARDTDDDGTDDFDLVYDAAGNLTDDDESYKYEYDAFYRLRKVKNQSDTLVAEYRYNGKGRRIAEHADTDDDGDVDVNDEWHHYLFDERWRSVAMFVDSDSDPTEEFVYHNAGGGGLGGGSYIDALVLRDRDTTGNGTFDERIFYCQNRRYDVVALVDNSGQVEMVRYSAYGVPFGLPAGDADSDGDVDSADSSQVQTWIDTTTYDVRGDLDLDGSVDADDQSAVTANEGASAGWGDLSTVASVFGARGAIYTHTSWYTRHGRTFHPVLAQRQARSYEGAHNSEATALAVWSSSSPRGVLGGPSSGESDWIGGAVDGGGGLSSDDDAFVIPLVPMWNHCGEDHGDGGTSGGGEPENEIDQCCQTHDGCYGQFGISGLRSNTLCMVGPRAACDDAFVACLSSVQPEDGAQEEYIRAAIAFFACEAVGAILIN